MIMGGIDEEGNVLRMKQEVAAGFDFWICIYGIRWIESRDRDGFGWACEGEGRAGCVNLSALPRERNVMGQT